MTMTVQAGFYLMTLGAGLILSFALYAARLRRRGLPAGLALTTLFFSIPFGYLFAKLVYIICRFRASILNYGLAAFIRLRPEEFSFAGGAIGVTLAVAMCARLRKRSPAEALDIFAPAGCLLVAFARAGEYFLGSVGWGDYLEIEWLCRFPFAAQNRYGEWFLAVFTFEALIALIICALALIREERYQAHRGLLFAHTAYSLCICQILPEMLRAVTIIFSFVRTEQVVCALTALGLLWFVCAKLHARGKKGAYRPLIWIWVLAGLNIALQFALDKPYLFIDPLPLSENANAWMMEHSAIIFYCIMVVCIVLMLMLMIRAAHTLAAKSGKRSR